MIVSLKKNSDFQEVYRNNCSCANRDLVGYWKKNGYSYNRIGISVSKKVGNSVVRHRLKRCVKEAYRLNQWNIQSGFDLVIVVRISAKDKDFFHLQKSLLHLFSVMKIQKNHKKVGDYA